MLCIKRRLFEPQLHTIIQVLEIFFFFYLQLPHCDISPPGLGRHTITSQECVILLKVSFDKQHPRIQIKM